MDVNELRARISTLEKLHADFERSFPRIYEEIDRETLFERVKNLYAISREKLDVASSLYKELAPIGGRTEDMAKELYRNEHQMKFRLEELLSNLAGEDYGARVKLKASLERLVQFHRVYDYAVRKALSELGGEVEGLSLFTDSENKKKVPSGIMDRLAKIDELEVQVDVMRRFLLRLYKHPGDVHKVEEALKDWHSRGLLWVEARNVEKLSGVEEVEDILEGLTLIGIVEKKMRGGEGVYRHRSFSSG